jgi:predicted AAA+ superfamily ATPase
METFRQAGDSLAGRYFSFRLHPISVREWCEQQGVGPAVALDCVFRTKVTEVSGAT